MGAMVEESGRCDQGNRFVFRESGYVRRWETGGWRMEDGGWRVKGGEWRDLGVEVRSK